MNSVERALLRRADPSRAPIGLPASWWLCAASTTLSIRTRPPCCRCLRWKNCRHAAVWPDKGSITQQTFACGTVAETSSAEGLNVSIAGGERIGVVGRTGSGKVFSSPYSCAGLSLRWRRTQTGEHYEPPLIDGIDALRIGVRARSKLGIIPQNLPLWNCQQR
jgi:ABC-type multidrug transport system fused ATPase/permease subunit